MTDYNIDPQEVIKNTVGLFKKLGLALPKQPDYIPEEQKELPENLGEMTAEELMNKIGTFTSLFSYASWLEASAKSEVITYERELKMMEAKYYSLAEGKVTDKKHEKDLAGPVVEAQRKLTFAEIRYNHFRALVVSYDKALFALSRALTLIQMDRSNY